MRGERFRVEGVEVGGDAGELVGEVSDEVGELGGDGGDAESGHRGLAVDGVHDDEVAPERAGLVSGEPDRWGREVLVGDCALDGGLPGAGGWVGDDAGDEVAVEFRRWVGETEPEHLGVEPTGQRRGRRGELEVRSTGGVAQRVAQEGGRRAVHRIHISHGIYRNGICRYCLGHG